MILLPSHNALGNVLHIILGPESDTYMDVHGNLITDLTEVINGFDRNSPIFLSITRSRDEQATLTELVKQGVKVASSFVGQAAVQRHDTSQPQPQPQPKAKTKICNYCGMAKELVPVLGFNICQSCLQIELGVNRINRGK